ncbi:MAG: lactonase family protein [Bryobacterales bacterium]|nr:lactonase family protein [Bryobacterales bacterium]
MAIPASIAAADYFAYIGTGGRDSKGIYAFRFDSKTGKLDPIGLVAEARRPSFVALHPSGRYLYAVAESNGGAVSAYSIDKTTGMLTLLNTVSSKGDGPCYVRVDPTGKSVLVANYSGGSVAVLPIEPDGKLRESTSFVQHSGPVADVKRQGGPRAHSFNPSPDNRFAVAADLGLDQLLVYRFDAAAGTITPNQPPFAKVAPRSGPRHFAFHPNGKKAYAINEISCTMTAFDYNAKTGVLKEVQTTSTLPPGVEVTPKMSTAEVQVHPSGKFLYGSNRGHDTIAVFSLASKGTMKLIENVSTQGKIPRNFSIDPSGSFLLAGHQDSNTIVVFRIDKKTGRLTPTGQTVETPAPICIRFLAIK